jgi:hypothetical protein
MIDPQSNADSMLRTRIAEALDQYKRQTARGNRSPTAQQKVDDEHTVDQLMATAMGRRLPSTLAEEYERLFAVVNQLATAIHWLATSGPEEDRESAMEALLIIGRVRQRRLVDTIATLLGFDLEEVRDALHQLPSETLNEFGARMDAVLGRVTVDTHKSCQCKHAFGAHDPATGRCRAPLCLCQQFGTLGMG